MALDHRVEEAALPHLTNAVNAAAERPLQQAQSWNLEAEIYRKLNQTDAAVAAYEKIATSGGLAADQRRLAVLKSVELLSGANRLSNAISRLEAYIVTSTNEPAVPGWLTQPQMSCAFFATNSP